MLDNSPGFGSSRQLLMGWMGVRQRTRDEISSSCCRRCSFYFPVVSQRINFMERYSLWLRICLGYLLCAYVFRNCLIVPKEQRRAKGLCFTVMLLASKACRSKKQKGQKERANRGLRGAAGIKEECPFGTALHKLGPAKSEADYLTVRYLQFKAYCNSRRFLNPLHLSTPPPLSMHSC